MGGFNGNGVYVRFHNWTDDAAANIDITASRFDTEDDGYATGLSNCICKDGQQTVTADIPFNSHKLTGVANATNRTDAATLGQVVDGGEIYASTSGTDTYTANLSPAITAYVTGMQVNLHFANTNATTTPTINLNSIGAKTIVRADGAALVAGDIDGDHVLRYDGADFRLLNPKAPNPGANTFTGLQTLSGAALNEASTTLASAATVNIGAAAANYIKISGTITIIAFDTIQAGTRRILEFEGALTLTHNATSLILPGAADITTAAGDVAIFVSEGSGNWRCVSYTSASSLPALLGADNTFSGDSTFSGTATFSSAVTVPDATASGNPVALGQFLQTLAATGYVALPNGFYIQWGNETVAAVSSTSFDFPVSFPGGCDGIIAMPTSAPSGNQAANYVSGVSKTGATIHNLSPSVSVSFFWLAIGS